MAGLPSSSDTFQMRLGTVSAISTGSPTFQRRGKAGFGSPVLMPKPQHQIHVLDGSTRGALAEIVVDRDQQRLRLAVVGEDVEPHAVGVVVYLGVDVGAALQRRERCHVDRT